MPSPEPHSRDIIRNTLERHARSCRHVLAMWEAGSAAFGRVDDYSDLDVGLIVHEQSNDHVWSMVNRAFADLGGIALRWHEPNPVFSGVDKHTYRLHRATRWLQIDVGLIPESSREFYNQAERHGTIQVVFDPDGRLAPPQWDAAGHLRNMRVALHHEMMKWKIYHGWFRKELARGRTIDAMRMHQAMTVGPLVVVLGMLHRPTRWDFHLRYVADEFPKDDAALIARLCYVGSPADLESRFLEADERFERAVAELASRGIAPIDPGGTDIGG
jgi:predicted nucleotidyltransferase